MSALIITNALLGWIACQIFWLNIQITWLREKTPVQRLPQVSEESNG